ncbi:hypothetical protein [Pseudoalteromonas sp. T1lg23B]|uniref:hypothetical protein n=1 Tax=Pseudoalteromonas sp. T1lg23B TaxID=2077097 RepID=UPI001319BF8E|nr:hypothetical protein [Pseudoalteromonas sp. T1lg23B]
MPITLHLILLFLAQITALLGGFMLGMFVHEASEALLPDILQVKEVVFIVFGMVPAALALLVKDYVFRNLITALCPKCGGRSKYRASRKEKAILCGYKKVPITYHCQECGYVHRTRIYSSSSANHH